MQVEPPAEFEAGLANLAAEGETELLVHLDGDGVVTVDAADQHVIVLRLRALDQRLYAGRSRNMP